MKNKAKVRNKDKQTLSLLKYYYNFNNFKFIILTLICSLIGLIVSIELVKSKQKEKINFSLYAPDIENFMIYDQPFASQEEFTILLRNYLLNYYEWEEKNVLVFRDDEYEYKNITSENININKFELNKTYSHKVKLSYVIDKKKYNYENILRLLKEYIQHANERVAENFTYKKSIILKNKILKYKTAYSTAMINKIDKPLNMEVYLFSNSDRTPPLIFKGYEVLNAEIQHMEKQLQTLAKNKLKTKTLFHKKLNKNNFFSNISYYLGGLLFGFFISFLIIFFFKIIKKEFYKL